MTKEFTLEHEFQRAMFEHKCLIIAGAIYAFESEITNNQLFIDVFAKTKENKTLEPQVDITRRIIEYTKNYDKNRFDRIYSLCWGKSRKFIPEDETYAKDEFKNYSL